MNSQHLNTSTPQPLSTASIPPHVIAHRGARAFAPENTLEAFEKAAALGADMIELDVQLSADGQLIVVHDDSLDRCSNVAERFPGRSDYSVHRFTLDEIQQLDAASWFVRALQATPGKRPPFLRSLTDDEVQRFISADDLAHYRGGKVRHPTLDEALLRACELGLGVNVELKASTSDSSLLVKRTVQLIESLNTLTPQRHNLRILVSSFDHTLLQLVKDLQPAVAIGVLAAQSLSDPVNYCQALSASAYHPCCAGETDCVGFNSDEFRNTGRLPRDPFQSLRAAGIDVNVWTENDPDRMKCLIEARASGIFTDYPNRLVEVLRSFRG